MGVSSQRNSSVGLNPINGMGSTNKVGHTKNNMSEVYGSVMSNPGGHSQIDLGNGDKANHMRGQST